MIIIITFSIFLEFSFFKKKLKSECFSNISLKLLFKTFYITNLKFQTLINNPQSLNPPSPKNLNLNLNLKFRLVNLMNKLSFGFSIKFI